MGQKSGEEPVRVTVFISYPNKKQHAEGFYCSYTISPLGLEGDVIATNPLLAIRFAIFQINIKLKHRFLDWTFYDKDHNMIGLAYEDVLH